ncbi:hypothetical protein [Shumkonia mesophila]|uniref:hypothetical protein n=1 Tax=Shumkonia mesophila TaxID=2838854 RepID=UPI0029341947|nr:hypothetical protein [Shumkonia mesophila]
MDITAETCPHYLLMDSRDVERWGGMVRINLPIREEGHAEALWQAMKEGVIDMIATDHAPHTQAEKTDPNIWNCCRGIPGVEVQMARVSGGVSCGFTMASKTKRGAGSPFSRIGIRASVSMPTGVALSRMSLPSTTGSPIVTSNLGSRRRIYSARAASRDRSIS